MPQSFINLLENNKNSYCLIFIYFFIIVLVIFITHKIKPLQMDSKPLTSQSLFWLAIGIPVFSFIYFGSFVWYQTNILLTPKGFENFIKYNALPLGLLSLSIPLSALVNNVHRTIQTDTQIRITKRKNEVDFFYSHKKRTIDFFKEELIKELIIDKAEIIKMMNDRAEKKEMQDVHTKISILKPYSAYNKWFPYASENSNNFNLSKEFIDQIHTFWNKIECLLSILLTQDNPHKYIMGMEILIQKSLRTAELPELKKITNNLIITTPLENGQQRSTGIFSNVFLKKLLTLLFNMCNDLFSYTNTTCLKKEKYHYLCKYIDEESLQINILNGSPVKNDDNKKMPSISNK